MKDPNSDSQLPTESKENAPGWIKWPVRILLGLTVFVLLIALIGLTYQAIASALDKITYPPPGTMVDVGGHSLHLYCTGEGDFTVILEAGAGSDSLTWSWVQPEIAKTARVCSYDRAGLGWSEPGPYPSDATSIVSELRAALDGAGIEGPFILVGH